jgi:hypothetical protein
LIVKHQTSSARSRARQGRRKSGRATPTAPIQKAEVKITPAKGRPMLTWVGKRPLSHVTAFPAQHVETFDPTGSFAATPATSELWKDWPVMYPRGGLLFHGDNKRSSICWEKRCWSSKDRGLYLAARRVGRGRGLRGLPAAARRARIALSAPRRAPGQVRMSTAVRTPEDGTWLPGRSVVHGARRSASRRRDSERPSVGTIPQRSLRAPGRDDFVTV